MSAVWMAALTAEKKAAMSADSLVAYLDDGKAVTMESQMAVE